MSRWIQKIRFKILEYSIDKLFQLYQLHDVKEMEYDNNMFDYGQEYQDSYNGAMLKLEITSTKAKINFWTSIKDMVIIKNKT